MTITFDPAKRDWTLQVRRVDFLSAATVLEGPTLDFEDDRRAYGETRIVSVGWLAGRADGGVRVDPARGGSPRHVDEESQ